MSETVLAAPLPLVWMGHKRDLPDGEWQRGWAFFCPDDEYPAYARELNPHRDTSRLPIVIMCPMGDRGTVFCIDALSTEKHEPWDVQVDMASLVVGERPDITVHPSIHIVGIWHGWCKHGVLGQTPDVA